MTIFARWMVLGLMCSVVSPARGEGSKSERREDGFPVAEPAAAGIDVEALERLRKRAEATESDAVVIVKDGKLVANWGFGGVGGPIEAMSATKSVVSLAIGRLIDEGKIKSLDQPVWEFYPEWKQGRKRQITIRHLLNHTSGLQNNPMAGEIYESPDFVQYALAAELVDDPGSKFSYNNKAVNLLAGVVQKASGERMDRYIGEKIFKPLGITRFAWTLDKAGNPHGMAGLQIQATDFAKVGEMMLDGGAWRGTRVVSEEWVKLSTKPGQDMEPTCGLLWWRVVDQMLSVDDALILDLKPFGPSDETIKSLDALKGKPMEVVQFWPAVGAILRKDEAIRKRLDEINKLAREGKGLLPKKAAGKDSGFMAQGYLGQFLVVLPEARLIAVRQFRSPADAGRAQPPKANPADPNEIDILAEFPQLVRDLVPSKPRK